MSVGSRGWPPAMYYICWWAVSRHIAWTSTW